MKKIILLLILGIFSINSVSAKELATDFFKRLTNKPTAEQRLAPVKKTYDDELTLSEQAIILYSENNPKTALETLLSIKDAERTAPDFLLIGNLLQDQNKITDATFMYKQAICTDPKFYKAYYNLGNIYLEEEKPYLAIENYKQVNKLNPKFAYAYYNLGCAYLKIGNLKKAKIVFLKAIELKSTEPDFHYNLAYTYKMLKKPELSKQYIGFYNKLIESNQN